MPDEPEVDSAAGAKAVEDLQAKVDGLVGSLCCECGLTLCGHQALFSIALGTSDRPLCLPCLARSMARPTDGLRDDLLQHFLRRECFHWVWNSVSEREGRRADGRPQCVWAEAAAQSIAVPSSLIAPRSERLIAERSTTIESDDVWDASDLACGDLLLQLRQRMQNRPPGFILCLVAQDRGAVEDIPAWCRLTGHRLLSEEHPRYRIERKNP